MADSKWFELFKDSQLQELIRTALVQNYDLRTRRGASGCGSGQSWDHPGRPVPQYCSQRRYHHPSELHKWRLSPPSERAANRTFGGVALNLLSFEVDIWGRLRRATEAAQADLLASEENRKAVITTLVSDVASAYFNLIELDLELEIARRTLTSREGSLQLIRTRRQGGVATLLELRQGEQLVYTAELAIPNIEQLIEVTENQISLLLGRSPGVITRGRSLTDQEQPPAVPPGLPSSLLERRPDIRTAEQSLVAANAIIGVCQGGVLPTN